jgi:hypothetical protein
LASYSVNKRAVARAEQLIKSRQYVLRSEWGDVQPTAKDENAFLESHSWEEYAEWHLGLRTALRTRRKLATGLSTVTSAASIALG